MESRNAIEGGARMHYGWIIAGVTFLVLLVGGGLRGSSGILVVPLQNDFQWSVATISCALAVNITMYGLVGPFAGAMMERGLRRCITTALLAVIAALVLTFRMSQAWQLVVLWGVVGAGCGVLANVLAATVATRWFEAKRGLVVGILTSASSAGQLIFLPLLTGIAVSLGWRWMVLAAAAVTAGLVPIVLLLMRGRPEELGLRPYGQEGTVEDEAKPATAHESAFPVLLGAIRRADFWLIAGSLFICGASTNGLVGTHLIAVCVDRGLGQMQGANLLATMAVFNFVGATASGWLTDRIDSRYLLGTYYALRALSLLYLPFAFDSFYGLSIVSVFYGLDWTATIPPTIRITADRFGTAQAGIMIGWLMAVHQLGGAAAALGAGILRFDLGSYVQTFLMSGALCLGATGMVLLISTPGAGHTGKILKPA
ncbi:MAG TPA: MFS transporter [Pseudolabrys sp.]|nr:MFS transporter [Pseudolabrys sp.]